MKVAVIGTGISGLVAARRLHRTADVTVFEAADYVGGHTATVDVDGPDGPVAVDTGFIVFNEKTYPSFIALLDELGVAYEPSDMSFSARCDRADVEYNGTSLNALFAQRRNVVRPAFWRMVRDILRFYREARELLQEDDGAVRLGDHLAQRGYSRELIDWHLIPMSAAIWSARPGGLLDFPAPYLVRFFDNHGFLQVDDRPQWLVVRGGSREYVKPLIEPFADRIRLRTPVVAVRRGLDDVTLETATGSVERFDEVVFATHADQTLRILKDATPIEREVLGAFEYQTNETVLHTDERIMPKRRRAWASWNVRLRETEDEGVQVTYWMNRLQNLECRQQYFVTLNQTERVAPETILRRFTYHHPIYTTDAVRAQKRHHEINGVRGTYFCGAYWGFGFHEDGVKSANQALSRVAEGTLA